jgi:uncharacterized LabA/DUF88 family protein
VDALQIGLDDKIDVAVLVTGDGDFLPLVRAFNKQGIRVLVAYFDFTDGQGNKSFINERLLKCCNYAVDIGRLEGDKDFKSSFKNFFRKPNGCIERIALESSDLTREPISRRYQEIN